MTPLAMAEERLMTAERAARKLEQRVAQLEAQLASRGDDPRAVTHLHGCEAIDESCCSCREQGWRP